MKLGHSKMPVLKILVLEFAGRLLEDAGTESAGSGNCRS